MKCYAMIEVEIESTDVSTGHKLAEAVTAAMACYANGWRIHNTDQGRATTTEAWLREFSGSQMRVFLPMGEFRTGRNGNLERIPPAAHMQTLR